MVQMTYADEHMQVCIVAHLHTPPGSENFTKNGLAMSNFENQFEDYVPNLLETFSECFDYMNIPVR